MSGAVDPLSMGLTPGIGVKFFRTGVSSANAILLISQKMILSGYYYIRGEPKDDER